MLGIAMTLLTVTYLSVQYLLALGRQRFLWVLVVVAAAEPILLLARDYSLLGFATAVLAVQAVAAVAVLAMGLGWRSRRRASPAVGASSPRDRNRYPPESLGGYELIWQRAMDAFAAAGHESAS